MYFTQSCQIAMMLDYILMCGRSSDQCFGFRVIPIPLSGIHTYRIPSNGLVGTPDHLTSVIAALADSGDKYVFFFYGYDFDE